MVAACQQDRFALYQAAGPQEATHFLVEALPSLVIVDVPGPLSDEVLTWLSVTRSAARTARLAIILSSLAMTPDMAAAALDAGADDCVRSDVSAPDLQARIRAILRCWAPELGGDELVVGPLVVCPRQREVHCRVAGAWEKLVIGPTEFRLLHFLMAHPGRAHSREALRCRLWIAEHRVSERTIDVHVRRLRQTLTSVGLEAAVETVAGTGYRLVLPTPD